MTRRAYQIPHVSSGEVRNWGCQFKDLLDSGETLSSSTTAEVTTTDLTITSTINTSSHVIDGTTAASGQAVIGTVQGQSAMTKYTMRVTAVTTESQTLKEDLTFWAE